MIEGSGICTFAAKNNQSRDTAGSVLLLIISRHLLFKTIK
jgi:hypothetical protein